MSALPKPEQLVDDFMLNDRRFGDSDLKLIIRSSGRSSFGIIPGMVCVFDSSMGDGQVFQVHCAIKKDDGPSVLAPYARKRTQDRFILLQSLYQYVDAESDDPTGWPLEFAGQRLLPLRKDLKLHPVVLARQLGVSPWIYPCGRQDGYRPVRRCTNGANFHVHHYRFFDSTFLRIHLIFRLIPAQPPL